MVGNILAGVFGALFLSIGLWCLANPENTLMQMVYQVWRNESAAYVHRVVVAIVLIINGLVILSAAIIDALL